MFWYHTDRNSAYKCAESGGTHYGSIPGKILKLSVPMFILISGYEFSCIRESQNPGHSQAEDTARAQRMPEKFKQSPVSKCSGTIRRLCQIFGKVIPAWDVRHKQVASNSTLSGCISNSGFPVGESEDVCFSPVPFRFLWSFWLNIKTNSSTCPSNLKAFQRVREKIELKISLFWCKKIKKNSKSRHSYFAIYIFHELFEDSSHLCF